MIEIPVTAQAHAAFVLLLTELENAVFDGADTLVSTPADEAQTATLASVISRVFLDSRNRDLIERLPALLLDLASNGIDSDYEFLVAVLQRFAASQTERLSAAGAFDD